MMKLRVEKLANIQEAEVEIKDLTLFVGQNSTHKSYMAHVIYELYKDLSKFNTKDRPSYDYVNQILKSIEKNLYSDMINLIPSLKIEKNKTLEEHKTLDGKIFIDEFFEIFIKFNNSKKLNNIIDKIFYIITKDLIKRIDESFNSKNKIIENLYLSYNIDKFLEKGYFYTQINKESDLTDDLIVSNISFKLSLELIDSISSNLNKYTTTYLPASRSSYMLTLDAMYAGIFNNSVRGKSNLSKFTEPTLDFIENFYAIKTEQIDTIEPNQKVEKLVNFLQNNIIKGKLLEEKNEFGQIIYYLESNNEKIDLQLASSMTLEVLPFIIFLKTISDIEKSFFVIEEPEAHLHPKAQIQMARFIVLLVKTGAKVLVTTHSDYILNEINNCIKLDSIEKENKFAISKDDVSAYLFKNEEKETTVNELLIDKFGIANDNFDEVLDELLDKSSELSEKILDNE